MNTPFKEDEVKCCKYYLWTQYILNAKKVNIDEFFDTKKSR